MLLAVSAAGPRISDGEHYRKNGLKRSPSLAVASPAAPERQGLELARVGDPEQGYHAGLPGRYFSKVNHNADGK